MVTGGKRAAQGGTFFEPTVLIDVTTDMVITKEDPREGRSSRLPVRRFRLPAPALSAVMARKADHRTFGNDLPLS